jgi:AAA+ superfamily predicted ATPase
MINKKNNNDFCEDDFDKLLNEFLEEELDKKLESDDKVFAAIADTPPFKKIGFKDYTSKGITYRIPKPRKRSSLCLEEDFKMAIEEDELQLVLPESPRFFIYGTLSDYTIRFSLRVDDVYFDPEDIVIALYKEGVTDPLFLTTRSVTDAETTVSVACDSPEFGIGNYFILVSGADPDVTATGKQHVIMGGNVRYDFSIMQHGENLSHPTVKSVTMCKKNKPYLIEPIMEVSFDTRQGSGDVYTFSCITDTYEPVGYNRDFVFNRKVKSKATVELGSRYMWVPGNYSVYVLHNNEPFLRVNFKYDGTNFEVVAHEYLHQGTPEFLFAKYMLTGSFAGQWRKLAEIPGYTDCKRMVASMVKNLVMNSLRNDLSTSIITTKGYCLDTDDEKFLSAFLPLVVGRSNYKMGDCAKFVEQKMSLEASDAVSEFFEGCYAPSVVLRNAGALLSSNGKSVLSRIESFVKEKSSVRLFLCGTESETRMLIESSPLLQRMLPKENVVRRQLLTLTEQVHMMQDIIIDQDFLLDGRDAEKALLALLTRMSDEGISTRWGYDELKLFFEERIYSRIRERVVNSTHYYSRLMPSNNSVVTAADLDIAFDEKELSPFEVSMRELNEMVGLGNLKEQLNVMFNNVKFEEMRRKAGLKVPKATAHHMIFTGNPGTGKTTVAKKIGRIFHSLGLLSKGEVIATERSQLVGRYIGETERNMQAVLEQARGNVLFIDEAYTLCDTLDDRKDFGYHVIDSLLTVLSQPNPDILVIMAGYKDNMETMMKMNKGLDGRFPYKFNFDDYSEDELMQIAKNLFAKNEYELADDAESALRSGVRDALAGKDQYFSNARWAEQLVADGIIPAMSMRVVSSGENVDRESLMLVKRCDVETALARFVSRTTTTVRAQKCVGFTY